MRQEFQRWDVQASMHLQGYISRQIFRGVHYCSPADRTRQRAAALPSRDTYDLMQPLIDAKNAWAADMRAAEEEGALPADNGREWWEGAIAYAEEKVARVRAQQAYRQVA